MCLSHDTLENYFKINFSMMQHFNYSLFEIDEMIPWEREIYLTMLMNHIEEQNEKMRQQEQGKY